MRMERRQITGKKVMAAARKYELWTAKPTLMILSKNAALRDRRWFFCLFRNDFAPLEASRELQPLYPCNQVARH